MVVPSVDDQGYENTCVKYAITKAVCALGQCAKRNFAQGDVTSAILQLGSEREKNVSDPVNPTVYDSRHITVRDKDDNMKSCKICLTIKEIPQEECDEMKKKRNGIVGNADIQYLLGYFSEPNKLHCVYAKKLVNDHDHGYVFYCVNSQGNNIDPHPEVPYIEMKSLFSVEMSCTPTDSTASVVAKEAEEEMELGSSNQTSQNGLVVQVKNEKGKTSSRTGIASVMPEEGMELASINQNQTQNGLVVQDSTDGSTENSPVNVKYEKQKKTTTDKKATKENGASATNEKRKKTTADKKATKENGASENKKRKMTENSSDKKATKGNGASGESPGRYKLLCVLDGREYYPCRKCERSLKIRDISLVKEKSIKCPHCPMKEPKKNVEKRKKKYNLRLVFEVEGNDMEFNLWEKEASECFKEDIEYSEARSRLVGFSEGEKYFKVSYKPEGENVKTITKLEGPTSKPRKRK